MEGDRPASTSEVDLQAPATRQDVLELWNAIQGGFADKYDHVPGGERNRRDEYMDIFRQRLLLRWRRE